VEPAHFRHKPASYAIASRQPLTLAELPKARLHFRLRCNTPGAAASYAASQSLFSQLVRGQLKDTPADTIFSEGWRSEIAASWPLPAEQWLKDTPAMLLE